MNFFADLPKTLPEELTECLVDSEHVRIERIISTGQSSPSGFWYDQPEHEWVMLLHGEAELEFEYNTKRLLPSNYILIPAHEKHRVSWTSTTETTVWLALFFDGKIREHGFTRG